jgi:putative transposase
MSNLRRISDPRTTYFITNVTYDRTPFLLENIDLFWQAINTMRSRFSLELQAWVILPDHFHFIIDTRGHAISNLIQRLKMSFVALYLKRINQKSGRVWQNRFWDHIIRDDVDWNCHVDYIHYNPVKHGYVRSPFEWKESSIYDFYRRGLYARDWGTSEIVNTGQFGE